MIRRLAVLGLLALAACPPAATAPTQESRAEVTRAEVTILFTSDEHGWLLPREERGKSIGGAAEMLAQWVNVEGHCPGPPSPPCKDPHTLALSGGDNYTGPAISSYFEGEPMAEALARMGYAASAFGNHELDFGRARFASNRKRSGMVYLAANIHAPEPLKDMALPAFSIFERRGIRIGVVGLATDTTLRTAMASRFEGVTFEAEEPALDRAVRDTWAAGADAVIVIAHECPDVLAPIVGRHPEWKLSFVGAGHCHKKMQLRAGAVPVISPGWRLDRYLRVHLVADRGRPAGDRVIAVEPTLVEGQEGIAPDAEIARIGAVWKEKVDQALGEEIGFTGAGMEKGSPELGRWITGAWRAELGAEVAIVNGGGIRQSVPRGPITKASVWGTLPFDNKLMLLKMKGDALARTLGAEDVVAGGASRGADGSWTVGGVPIDPARTYSVATIDFLYYGGHMGLSRAVEASNLGVDWREPVIAWTRKQSSTRAAPIELELR